MTLLSSDPRFVEWATRAVAGLDDSRVMMGIMGPRNAKPARLAFALQIGHCLLEDKPICLIVARGEVLPDKLRAVATVIEEYTDGDQESMYLATKRALSRVGMETEN